MFRIRCLFVHFKCELGRAYAVAATLSDTIEECAEVYSISGEYDLLARFNLDGDTDPGLFVTGRLQSIEGVVATYTTLAFNAFTPNVDPA